MAAIFFGWELGANLGHVGKFLPLARALRNRGHDVAWAVASAAVGPLLEKEGFAWHLAPADAERPRPGPPLSFADILLRFGYADAAGLRDRVERWRAVPAARLQAIEDAVLAGINTVLAHHGRPGLAALWRLFAVAEDALLGFPELDHYAQRGAARYWGALPDASLGAPPAWPDLPGTRLFAYLRRDCAHHEAALAALHELGLPTVAFIPDLTAEQEARFAAPHLVFSRAPVDLGAAAATAGAAVTYAGFSTTTRFLLAGKPLLLLPGHLEQYLLARRIAALGAGRCIPADGPPAGLAAALRHVVTDPGHAAAAQAFARKYAAFPQETVLANLVRRIEEIVAPPPAGDGPKEKP